MLLLTSCNQQITTTARCERERNERNLHSHDIYRAIAVELCLSSDFICYDLCFLTLICLVCLTGAATVCCFKVERTVNEKWNE